MSIPVTYKASILIAGDEYIVLKICWCSGSVERKILYRSSVCEMMTTMASSWAATAPALEEEEEEEAAGEY